MSFRSIGAVLGALFLSWSLSACATVGAIAETPATVRLDRSKDNVEVTCDKEGHQQASETLSASFTGTTIGNVLLGGLIGVAVDAASGANNRYPEYVLLVLNPTQFPNGTVRDQYYMGVRDKIAARANASIAKIRQECASNMAELCNTNVKKVEEARDLEFGKLEQRRLQSRVTGQG
jgi:hypothetical protein